MEVCLDGVFGREHRKLVSVIPAGFGSWENAEDHWRGISGRRTGACRDFSILFGWNLLGGTYSGNLFRGVVSRLVSTSFNVLNFAARVWWRIWK